MALLNLDRDFHANDDLIFDEELAGVPHVTSRTIQPTRFDDDEGLLLVSDEVEILGRVHDHDFIFRAQ